MSRNITIGKVRFSYANVFQPRKNRDSDNQEEKYSVAILIPKNDVNSYNAIMAGIEEAKQEGLNGDFKGSIPPVLALPIHDGDGVKENSGEPYGPECKGHWVLNSSNKMQPFVVDANVQPILQQNAFYSGCYGMVSIRFFPYAKGKRGIGCSLNGVQKLEDGEPLGGGITPEEAFRAGMMPASAQGAWPVTSQQPAPAYNPAPAATYPSAPAAYAPQYQAPYQQTATQAPAYQTQAPVYQAQQQPAYNNPNPGYAQGYPGTPQVDPITGQPYIGGVMGI